MTMASDGLNHQGGIAFIIDASTLEMITNYGQTSGHSFANSLLKSNEAGFYIGMDLGDNYPRGVNLWELKAAEKQKKSKLVYKFKTRHGTNPTSPAGTAYDEYTEISTSEKKFYKWSNDNYCYTELAHPGIHEIGNESIIIFFAGENPPLDNSQTGEVMNAARNVGWVKISRDLSSDTVLSPGEVETGGFYTFGGGWSEQTNQGISFLTSYTEMTMSVSRLKTMPLGENILLLYELWSATAYTRSQFMVVDTSGNVVRSATDLATSLKLPFADQVVASNGRAVAYVGTKDNWLVRYELCVGSSCEASGAGGTPSPGTGNTGGTSGSTTAPFVSGAYGTSFVAALVTLFAY
ncbi:unnamed protein product [Effrenium voratum]|uniref:Uncharacterized protein n=2 Tax=Effrenium voratum TaxID=2562239 RepID=A0AA36N135_9DINO|nr:unnamed protein product [Effrenium voratum]